MRVNRRKPMTFATLLLACLTMLYSNGLATVTPIAAETTGTVIINEMITENGDSYVRYPQISGMENTAAQQAINDEIVDEAKIAQRLLTLSILQPGGTGLQVGNTTYLDHQLLSVVISAKGLMENMRSGHAYTALSYDLLTGNRLTLTDLFIDPDAAVRWMEEQLLSGYVDELSNYLEYADVTPLPVASFAIDENGITFYYPYTQLGLLSGYSGAVQFQYGELQDFLLADETSVPVRLNAIQPQYTDAQIAERIAAVAAEGTLPYLSVHLGDSIPDLLLEYRLVRTPDQYPGGRYIPLEAPAFRQILLLTDALTQSYDASVVEGIMAMRMNLFGLQTGVTARSRWLQILGEPSPSVYLDDTIAVDYGLPVGTADYYTLSGRQLMLYADANDTLYAVRLTK